MDGTQAIDLFMFMRNMSTSNALDVTLYLIVLD